jgi:hypothetical protein
LPADWKADRPAALTSAGGLGVVTHVGTAAPVPPEQASAASWRPSNICTAHPRRTDTTNEQ